LEVSLEGDTPADDGKEDRSVADDEDDRSVAAESVIVATPEEEDAEEDDDGSPEERPHGSRGKGRSASGGSRSRVQGANAGTARAPETRNLPPAERGFLLTAEEAEDGTDEDDAVVGATEEGKEDEEDQEA